MLLSDLTLLAAVSLPLIAGQQHGQRQTGPITLPLVRHTPRNNLVKRDAAETSIFTDPLFTAYRVNVTVGTPPQTVTLALQSYSSDLVLFPGCKLGAEALPCSPLSSLSDGLFYNASLSTSFATDHQTLSAVAPYNASQGVAANDTMEFAGQSTTQAFVYDRGNTMTGLAYEVAGQLGFGLEGVVANTSLWQTLSAQWPEPMFGIYLGQHTAITAGYGFNDTGGFGTAVESGQLTLGGLNQSLYTGDVEYFDLVNTSFWSAPLNELKVGDDTVEAKFTDGSKLNLSPSISLAQQFTFLPDSLVDALHAKIPGAEKHEFAWCRDCGPSVPNMTLYQVPCSTSLPITFTFGNIDITANASQWTQTEPGLWRTDGFETNDAVCISTLVGSNVQGTEYAQDPEINRFYLGWQFVQNVYMAFKYGDSPQLGFARLAPGLPVLNGDLVAQENGWEPYGPGESAALAAASAANATAGAGGANADGNNGTGRLGVGVVTTVAAALLAVLGGLSLF